MRLIDADVLSDEVAYSQHNNPHTDGKVKLNHHNEHDHFLNMIFNAPTVDAVPVVHGRWEFVNDYQSRCTACTEVSWVDHTNEPNYCPNCGAKMDGGAEDA